MKITVVVKPSSRRTQVEIIDPTHLRVCVRERPIDGQANAAVIQALAEHFDIPKSTIALVRGVRSRIKVLELPEFRIS